MSRVFDGDNANFLQVVADLGITASPYTFACWLKVADIVGAKSMFAYVNATGKYIKGQTSGADIRGIADQTIFSGARDTGVNAVADTWIAMIVEVDSSGDCRVYSDGGTSASVNVGAFITPSSPEFNVGVDQNGSYPLDGNIAHMTVWDSELTGAQVAAFIAGDNPTTIDAGNQLAYWPLTDSNLTDEIGSKVLVVNGTVVSDADDNPPVIPASGGWNNVVKPQLLTSDVTRVSDTEIDITLQAYATFDITADEDVTPTIPAAALDSGGPIVATPAFTISVGVLGGFLNRNFFWGNY